MTLTKNKIIKLFNDKKPRNAKEARKLGLSLTYVGSGAFRSVFVVNKKTIGKQLVVKFLNCDTSRYCENLDNIAHAQHELTMIRKINKTQKLAALRPFIPEVHYEDFRHGVLLTDFYYRLVSAKRVIVRKILDQVAEAVLGAIEDTEYDSRDIAHYNIMQTKDGEFKLIDLGLL